LRVALPRWWLILLAALAALAAAPEALAGRPYLGVYGARAGFPDHPVQEVITGWDQGLTWGSSLTSIISGLRPRPMLGFSTSKGWPNPQEAVTPQGIAAGAGDAYLIALNRAINEYGSVIYVRPMGEMDGWWNPYCAFNENGSPRSPAHSTRNFRRAFARVYILLHGGTRAFVNARLARLGLPGVREDLVVNPKSRLRVIWNPLGFSQPKRPGNTPAAYYPGDPYVDIVGGDVYKTRTNVGHFTAVEDLYKAHPNKPFAIPEWGLQGVDDPDFVARMAAFIKTHGRLEVVVFYNDRRGSEYDLASKPLSRAAYRRLIAPLGRRR